MQIFSAHTVCLISLNIHTSIDSLPLFPLYLFTHTYIHTQSLLLLSGVGGGLGMTSPAGTLCSGIVTTALHLSCITNNHIEPALLQLYTEHWAVLGELLLMMLTDIRRFKREFMAVFP